VWFFPQRAQRVIRVATDILSQIIGSWDIPIAVYMKKGCHWYWGNLDAIRAPRYRGNGIEDHSYRSDYIHTCMHTRQVIHRGQRVGKDYNGLMGFVHSREKMRKH
jgi:hypothetical protein